MHSCCLKLVYSYAFSSKSDIFVVYGRFHVMTCVFLVQIQTEGLQNDVSQCASLEANPYQGTVCFMTSWMNPNVLQSNLRHFLDATRRGEIDKIMKFTNKGLDPNFHDNEAGGKKLQYFSWCTYT